jgi:hypothetical protein
VLLDRFGKPIPEPTKHVRALGFHGGTRPLKDDEDVVEYGRHVPELVVTQPNDPPVAV